MLQGRCPDLIWSDPPYGIKCQKKNGTIGGSSGEIHSKKYPHIAGDGSTETAISSFNLCQELFPTAVQVWWGANHYCEGLPNSSCWIVWDKLNGDNNFADCELAWTNQKSAVRKFSFMWNGLIKQGESANKKRMHPNQKPVEIVTWFWDKYCEDKLLCFDPFLGSGTSIIAAEKDGDRIVYGCELMPEYADLVLQRWEQESGKMAELIESESAESILGF